MVHISHFGISVPNPVRAAKFYCALFEMEVVVREARIREGYATVPPDFGPDEIAKYNLEIGMVALKSDRFVLSLQEKGGKDITILEHAAIVIPEPAYTRVRKRVAGDTFYILRESPGRFVFVDRFRMTWEITDQDVLLTAYDTTGFRINERGEVEGPAPSPDPAL